MACGFFIPVIVLGGYAAKRLDALVAPKLLKALGHSLEVSLSAAFLTLIAAFVFSYAIRTERSRLSKVAARLGSMGYGVPGTVLAIGVLIPLASLDNGVDGFIRSHFGFSSGLLLSGTAFAIIYAHAVRFMTMAEGTLDAGFHKLSPHIDMASRTLGRNRAQTLFKVLLPNMAAWRSPPFFWS